MSLLAEVIGVLEREHVAHALIGAAAMAIQGVSRSTIDVDLLTVDPRVLRREWWDPFERRGAALRVLRGDIEDPLAGSVRISEAHAIVDVVVGRHAWQRELIEAAPVCFTGDVRVAVAAPASLVLLKLYAGGPKDAWDIRSLLETAADADQLRAEVDAVVGRLPADARGLWKRLRGPEASP